MRTRKRLALLTLILVATGLFLAACGDDHADDHGRDRSDSARTDREGHDPHDAEEDGHEGHDHGNEADEPEHEEDGHEGHDHGDEADEPEHEEDGHEGHDHGDEADEPEHEEDGHEGHDDDDEAHEADAEKDEHAGHDHGAEEAADGLVELTAEQRRRIGLETAVAGPGRIGRDLSFPGEVELNPDRVAHVVPRAAGIVREVKKTLGDTVETGEILAWIESAELAEAKLTFFAKEAEVGCCAIALPRAREVFENVHRLATLLDKSPSPEELSKLDGLEMGEYRGNLITAYAGFVAAEKAYERERGLRAKAISSGQELVAAQAEFQRARAEFKASLETARFAVIVAFSEAARARQVAEFEAVAAEQGLRLMGVDDETIAKLRGLVPKTAGMKPCECDEADCKENEIPSLRGVLGKDRRLGWYALRAPFAGVIIDKHLTLGELAGEDESAFEIADPSTVWVMFGVYQKDLGIIKPGQKVSVTPTGGTSGHAGRIAYLSPLIDPGTRTVRARVVLANEGNGLRPGLFVTVRVELPSVSAAVLVPRSAVQVLDEEQVVFVMKGGGFETVPVTLGRGDRDRVEVKAGLKAGQRYVTRGAFELKAKIATSGMDAHAGHGH